ncbi:MCE family protein [Mycolicibacterium flavescens]|uniref:Mammalian cell entry protein n=1 Tax=Mycolicibacterium flavescens TaxID=1776 RepID=A0A1E3RDK7_MYCFV|nr:MlaD family protein [Mycolicibacterium flavescens]MCV7282446.1 MCE family protein [Mycolicibacterium flavescens]ODQ87958.1 mammalian cell entry protein [Mycolicibacterium flavescens]
MTLTRRIWIQLIVVAAIALAGVAYMFFPVLHLPALLFGVGQYTVTAQLPEAGGLYERGNVTYRGYQVGRVESVGLTDNGVEAVLSLNSDVEIPSDVKAEVHSVSAIGEQYIDLIPRSEGSPPLKDGDVIARDQTSVPPNISSLLSATNKGLQAIPQDNLKTVVDEAYVAFGGLGPEIGRFLKGASALALDAKANVNELTTLVDKSKPLLDTQTETSGSIEAWAANLATVTDQLRDQDADVATVLKEGPGAADEVRALFSQLQPTLPVVLANLASVAEVAAVYRPNLEQLLVLLPQGAAIVQATGVPNRNTKVDYPGAYLSFNLNLNLPPACTTGFLPAQQRRAAAHEDYPPVPEGDMYCRVAQDSPFNVRGARNTPCVQKPGKRAPTAKLCESDEEFVPLNDGYNWKGDPNATLSGQSVPAPRDPAAPGAGLPDPAPAPPVAVAEYDPASGQYMAPDGKMYTQSDLGAAGGPKSWQDMLAPPAP